MYVLDGFNFTSNYYKRRKYLIIIFKCGQLTSTFKSHVV